MQKTKRVPFQEPYMRVTQNFSPGQTSCLTEPIRINTWSLMRKQVLNSLTPLMLIPAAQSTIHVILPNGIVTTTTDIKFHVCLGMVPATPTYTTPGFWESVTEWLRSNHVPTNKTPVNSLEQHQIVDDSLVKLLYSQKSHLHFPDLPAQCILVCPWEPFRIHPRKRLKFLFTDTIHSKIRFFRKLRGYFRETYSMTTQLCKVTTTGYIQLTKNSNY